MPRRRSRSIAVSFFSFQDIITSVVGIFILITLIMVLELAQTVAEGRFGRESMSGEQSASLLASVASLRSSVGSLQAEYDELSAQTNRTASINKLNRDDHLRQLESKMKLLRDQIDRAVSLISENKEALSAAGEDNAQLIARSKEAESRRQDLESLLEQKSQLDEFSAILEIDRPIIYRDTTETDRWLVLVVLEQGEIHLSDSEQKRELRFSSSDRISKFHEWLTSRNLSAYHLLLIVKPSGSAVFSDVISLLQKNGATYGYDVAAEASSVMLRFELDPGR